MVGSACWGPTVAADAATVTRTAGDDGVSRVYDHPDGDGGHVGAGRGGTHPSHTGGGGCLSKSEAVTRC